MSERYVYNTKDYNRYRYLAQDCIDEVRVSENFALSCCPIKHMAQLAFAIVCDETSDKRGIEMLLYEITSKISGGFKLSGVLDEHHAQAAFALICKFTSPERALEMLLFGLGAFHNLNTLEFLGDDTGGDIKQRKNMKKEIEERKTKA